MVIPETFFSVQYKKVLMARKTRVSSGWAFAYSFSVDKFQELAKLADGLELMATSQDRFEFLQDANIEMKTASLHLQSLPETQTQWYYKLDKSYPIETVVVHATDDKELMKSARLEIKSPPLSFENLDNKSENKFKALDVVKRSEAMVTIDIQHLAETQTSAESQTLIDELSDRILQFHISGRTDDSRHELVVNADNRGKIVPLLEYIATHHKVSEKPWVIEGRYKTLDAVQEEVEFLREFN